jgi:hypothetical protein
MLRDFVPSQSFAQNPIISASPSPSVASSEELPVIVNTTFAIRSAAGTFIVVFGFAALFRLIVRRCYGYEMADYSKIEM